MTLRLAADPAAAVRRSITVAAAALAISVDPTTIRDLLRTGGLEGHRVGKRAMRVYIDSIDDYQLRMAIAATSPAQKPALPRRRRFTAAKREAQAYLRGQGLM